MTIIKNKLLDITERYLSSSHGDDYVFNLEYLANNKWVSYEDLSITISIEGDNLSMVGNWDLLNINDDEDEDNDVPPCDDYDERFTRFIELFEDDFDIIKSSVFLSTNELIIKNVTLKLK